VVPFPVLADCGITLLGCAIWTKTLVIQDNDKPLEVLLKYEHFLAMEEHLLKNEQ
jgi:hypothetical protein